MHLHNRYRWQVAITLAKLADKWGKELAEYNRLYDTATRDDARLNHGRPEPMVTDAHKLVDVEEAIMHLTEELLNVRAEVVRLREEQVRNWLREAAGPAPGNGRAATDPHSPAQHEGQRY